MPITTRPRVTAGTATFFPQDKAYTPLRMARCVTQLMAGDGGHQVAAREKCSQTDLDEARKTMAGKRS